MKHNVVRAGAVLAGLLPLPAFAFTITQVLPPIATGPITGVNEGLVFVQKILGWVAILFWIAAIGFIFYAGFLYLTARGEAEQVTKANHALIYAIIAIIVGLMAYAAPAFVNTSFTQTPTP